MGPPPPVLKQPPPHLCQDWSSPVLERLIPRSRRPLLGERRREVLRQHVRVPEGLDEVRLPVLRVQQEHRPDHATLKRRGTAVRPPPPKETGGGINEGTRIMAPWLLTWRTGKTKGKRLEGLTGEKGESSVGSYQQPGRSACVGTAGNGRTCKSVRKEEAG